MICNICYRASNPSMHCAWLGPSFEVCNTVIPPVVVKKRVVTVVPLLRAPRATPRPLDDLYERKPSQAVISANLLASRPSPTRKSPSALAQRRAKRARSSGSSDATPPPSSFYSRESSIVSSASLSHASTRNRSSPPTSLPPSTHEADRVPFPSFLQYHR
jgi:hypothetical protein